MQKTFGLAGPLREALDPLAGLIQAAFVYGSVAKKQDSAASDIDLMLISDTLSYADVYAKLADVETFLGRRVNPTLYNMAEVRQRVASDNAFVTQVLDQPKLWLIGSEHDITP